MSYDMMVYLKRSNMPSPQDWQKAIISDGFPVRLDSDFDVDSFSGFLPCPVEGKLSGFEYHSSVLTADDERDVGVPADADFSILFCLGPQPLELMSALAAASVLAEVSGGVLCDLQEGEFFSSDVAVAWAKSQLSQ